MDQLGDIQPATIVIALMLSLLVGVVFALIQLRKASASRGSWAQLGYRPVAGGRRTEIGRQAAHCVRVYRGFEVHYLTRYKAGFGKTEMVVSWVCQLPRPARFGLQVVEAGLAEASLGAKASRALSPYQYNWKPRFSERIRLGDREFDTRFAAFGTDHVAARSFLTDPDLRPVLLSLKHVDLTVAQNEVRYHDPFNVNLWGLSGQALGRPQSDCGHSHPSFLCGPSGLRWSREGRCSANVSGFPLRNGCTWRSNGTTSFLLAVRVLEILVVMPRLPALVLSLHGMGAGQSI